MPAGDILIHAGDATLFGSEEHARSFNDWLGSLNYTHKVVVPGTHEYNAAWLKRHGREVLSNARVLVDEAFTTPEGYVIYGSNFMWPCKGDNPYYDLIPANVDILVSHQPCRGVLDGRKGCPALAAKVAQLKPMLFVNGHVHEQRGVEPRDGVFYANAAVVDGNRQLAKQPLVFDFVQ